MISPEQDLNAVEVDFSAIYKAISYAELKMRMKRDELLQIHADAVRRAKWNMKVGIYCAHTGLIMRLFHFMNSTREAMIRKIRLSGSESLLAETQGLEMACDMRHYNADQEIAHRLRKILALNVKEGRHTLWLTGKYLTFVQQYNPEAFTVEDETTAADTAESEGAPASAGDDPYGRAPDGGTLSEFS